jgi:uncharacterized OB-fold protein
MAAQPAYTKPIPNLDDPDMRPFWDATYEHRLVSQRCDNCGTLRFPPLPICDTCLHEGAEWVDVSKQGTIWSYVVYHRAFHPGFEADVPYVVAIVQNDDGLSFPGMVLGPRDAVEVGHRVSAVFQDATAEFTMLAWTTEVGE